eukprot:s2939_g2.t1
MNPPILDHADRGSDVGQLPGGFRSGHHHYVSVTDIEPSAFKCMLRYVHHLDPMISLDNALQVYRAADKYQIDGLLEGCDSFIEENTDAGNVTQVLRFFDIACRLGLERYSKHFLELLGDLSRVHTRQVLQARDFLHLHTVSLTALLSYEGLCVNEERLWKALRAWAELRAMYREGGTEHIGSYGEAGERKAREVAHSELVFGAVVAAGSHQIEEAAVPGCQDAEAAEFSMWLVAESVFRSASSFLNWRAPLLQNGRAYSTDASRDEAFMERLRTLAREALPRALKANVFWCEALTWHFLEDHQRLLWAAALEFDADLPPWFCEQQNFTRRQLGWDAQVLWAADSCVTELCQFLAGVDLFSLDGKRAVLCRAGNATHQDVKRFLRTANCVCKARSPSSVFL